MKYLLTLCFLCCSCNIVGDAAKACQEVVNKEAPEIEAKIWEECSSYYENTVLPEIRLEIKNATAELLAQVDIEVTQQLTAMGCVKMNGVWDCSGLCR